MESYLLKERQGLNRNHVEGIDAPTAIIGLRPGREGGWIIDGEEVTLSSSALDGVVKGWDNLGWVASRITGGFGKIQSPSLAIYTSDIASIPPDSSFITEVGLVGANRQYFILDQENNELTDTNITEDNTLVTVAFIAGGNLPDTKQYYWIAISFAKARRGKFVRDWAYGLTSGVTGGNKTLRFTAGTLPANTFTEIYVWEANDDAALPTYAGQTKAGTPLELTEIPIGDTLGSKQVKVMTFDESVTPTSYLGRMWGVYKPASSPLNSNFPPYSFLDGTFDMLENKKNVLIFSSYGFVNLMTPANYEIPSFTSSSKITALVPTSDNSFGEFGGLLIFGENEALIATGVPGTAEFTIRRYPSIIGCDAGVHPTSLSSTTFVVWQGAVYAVSGGEAKRISTSIELPGDPIVRVVTSPVRKSIMCKTLSNKLFEYWTEYGTWTTPDIFSGLTNPYPNPFVQNGYIFMTSSGALRTYGIGSIGTSNFNGPMIQFKLSCGNKFMRKGFRKVRLPVAGIPSPMTCRMYYSQSGSSVYSNFVDAKVTGDYLIFTLPRSIVGLQLDFVIQVITPSPSLSIEYPIVLEYIERNIVR